MVGSRSLSSLINCHSMMQQGMRRRPTFSFPLFFIPRSAPVRSAFYFLLNNKIRIKGAFLQRHFRVYLRHKMNSSRTVVLRSATGKVERDAPRAKANFFRTFKNSLTLSPANKLNAMTSFLFINHQSPLLFSTKREIQLLNCKNLIELNRR